MRGAWEDEYWGRGIESLSTEDLQDRLRELRDADGRDAEFERDDILSVLEERAKTEHDIERFTEDRRERDARAAEAAEHAHERRIYGQDA